MSSILDGANALVLTNNRRIARIIPDVVIEENSNDRLQVTAHPVEDGASVSDHAFMLPRTVEMRLGFSDSTGGYTGYSRDRAAALRALQEEREPFTVYGGKRIYNNMLATGIASSDDARTKHSVMLSVQLQEVRIVSVKTTSGASAGDQASPEKTAESSSIGTIQPGTANWTQTGSAQGEVVVPGQGAGNWSITGPVGR